MPARGNTAIKYYKQFSNHPNIYLLALLAAGGALVLIFSMDDLRHMFGMAVCTLFLFLIAWVLWKSRAHFLDIDRERIVHHGFRHWDIRRADVTGVEYGRKRWFDDRELYLKVRTVTGEYSVDSGFLLNKQRVEELARIMGGHLGISNPPQGRW
jgi:hypothetical protein